MTKLENGELRYQVQKSNMGFYILDTVTNEPIIMFETQEDCQAVADGMNK